MPTSAEAAWLSLSRDMNGDGQFTLTDVRLFLAELFFLPGDAILWLVLRYAPGLGRFLELGPDSYGGLLSAMLSAAVWLFAIVMLGAVFALLRDLDQALTRRISTFYGDWQRRGRIARRWLVCRARLIGAALRLRRRRPAAEVHLDEVELDELEIDVLRSHALLAPGCLLGVGDLAVSLEIRRAAAQRALDRLERLALIQRGLGTSDGETGYCLTAPGQFVLAARETGGKSPGAAPEGRARLGA